MATYTNITGAWIETIPRVRTDFGGSSPTFLNQTARVLDAANESFEISGKIRISGGATGVAFDTNSRIIWRSGTGNVFVQITSVLRIGVQNTAATGPPATGDGTFDVYGDIPSVTYADIADSTTYAVPMTTVANATTLSDGDLITIRIELVTFTVTDTVRLQSFLNDGAGAAASFLNQVPNLNGAITTSSACPLILDFEGDNTVLGIIEIGHPHIESQDSIVTVASGNYDGMMVRSAANIKVDGFWMLARLTDAVNCELYSVTDPTGTPTETLLATVDGDQTLAAGICKALYVRFPPVELPANTNMGFVLKSLGTSLFTYPMTYRNINDIALFEGCGVNDIRITRTGGSGAFTASTLKQHLFGLRICAVESAGGGSGGVIMSRVFTGM